MPYKSLEDKRKHDRDDKRRKRGATSRGDTAGTTEMFEGKPRYLTLSDGQVFDRTYRPRPNKHLPSMIACNRANTGVIRLERGILGVLTDPTRRKKLEKIHQTLKDHNVLKEVRYGIEGPTFDVVGELLEVTQ